MVIHCRRFLISGRVQGVYFRGSTARKARQLQVTGYARNLPDGRVEVLACGDGAAVAALEAWLWQGPPASSVRDISADDVTVDPPQSFSTA